MMTSFFLWFVFHDFTCKLGCCNPIWFIEKKTIKITYENSRFDLAWGLNLFEIDEIIEWTMPKT